MTRTDSRPIPPAERPLWVHFFDIRSESDIDDELMDLLREARAVGDQEHLRRRARVVAGPLSG